MLAPGSPARLYPRQKESASFQRAAPGSGQGTVCLPPTRQS